MKKYKITWQGNVYGEIEIEANTVHAAKEKLSLMNQSELIKISQIWNSDKPVKIEGADTHFGFVDEQTWVELEDS